MSFALLSAAPAGRALRPRHRLTLWVLAFSSAACSTLPAASSSVIGCFEDDIEISNAQNGPNGDTWTATCRRNVYDCAREEETLQFSGWDLIGLNYTDFRGTKKGQTYCIRREEG